MLLFVATVTCFEELAVRIQESEMSHGTWVPPYDEASLVRQVAFETEGWVQPGLYPAQGTDWLHPNRTAYTAHQPGPRRCAVFDGRHQHTRVCYTTSAESFWVGRAVPISPLVKCPRRSCAIAVESVVSLESTVPFPAIPRDRWRAMLSTHPPAQLREQVSQHIAVDRTIAGPARGFLWFKPLYWAVSGLASHAVFHAHGSNVSHLTANSIYPLVWNSRINGFVGFSPTEPPRSVQPLKLIIDY